MRVLIPNQQGGCERICPAKIREIIGKDFRRWISGCHNLPFNDRKQVLMQPTVPPEK
jgi:hypothetical protein